MSVLRRANAFSQESQEKSSEPSKQAHPSCLENLSLYFTEYCNNASIHGLKFLGERHRFFVEKIWWTVLIVMSLYFCVMLIVSTYNKWMTAPVIVSFATSETPVWKIPFPTVTVCPLIKSEKAKFDFADIVRWRESNTEFDEEEARRFSYMSLVCPSTLKTFTDENATDTIDDRVIDFLMQVAPNFDLSTFSCIWAGEDCTHIIDDFFSPILTSGGVCHSLNMLDRDEIFTTAADIDYYNVTLQHQPKSQWTLQDGYFNETEFQTYPRRTVLSGPNGGLDLVLVTPDKDIDYSCEDSIQGFKILVHNPAQMPRSHQQYFWLPLDQEVSVAVKPNMMTTSEKLKSYKPSDRKCYFTNEKHLKFFTFYNQQNCLLECLTNNTLRGCQCVGFYMPRENSTPICGPAMQPCITQINLELLTNEAIFQIKRDKKVTSTGKKKTTNCDCLPSCHSLHYDVEISQMAWNWHEGNILTEEYNSSSCHLSRLKIYFKDMQFMTSERNELYGQTEFWANCGGLLGLFTGFSFISLVEILYFVTLRLFCNLKKFGRHYWSGSDELMETMPENSL